MTAEHHEVHDNSNVNDKSISKADNENLLVEGIRRQMLEFTESINSKIEAFETELNNLTARSVPMFVLEGLEATVKELRTDKDNLLKENSELREKNLNYALITSDLYSKVKDLQHERDSLVTG